MISGKTTINMRKFIQKIFHEVKHTRDLPKDIFVILVVAFVAFGAFIIGRYSALEERRAGELRIVDNRSEANVPRISLNENKARNNDEANSRGMNITTSKTAQQGMYVGAKSGKTYYLPWCSGAKRILEKNQIWFANKVEAEQRGYKPSSSCKGI